jgi:hypothetical protein
MQAARRDRFHWTNLHRPIAFGVVLGTSSLNGCTQRPDDPILRPSVAQADSTERPAVEPAPAAPVAPPLPRPVAKAKPVSRALARAKTPAFNPGMLVGLGPPAVDRILGKPAGTRADAMAVEWTYTASSCSLSIFFYPDIATGALRALKYNVTDRGNGDGHACVNFLVMARSDESG